METVLSIKNISKRFGHIQAVDNLSLEVEKGNVYGILGPNGSGKTTTLGIILDIINANSGDYYWFGKPPSKESRKRIGSLLESPAFYPYLSAVRNLKIICDIKGLPYNLIDKILEKVGLAERRNSKYNTYSFGMKQRLAIAAALLGDPEVLILDEPTNGLDPQGIAEIRELILRIASESKTIILASHMLDEVQKTCSHVAILKRGRILFTGDVNEVLVDTAYLELASDDMDLLYNVLSEYDKIESIEKDGNRLIVAFKTNINSSEINNYLFSKGICLSHLALRKKSLEKHVLELLAQAK